MLKYQDLKKILFKFEPETAHHIAEFFLRLPNLFSPIANPFLEKFFVDDEILKQNIFDKTFYNPIGLAAGFDKNATMVRGIGALGFGFTEVGTITPLPQDGNEKPRMFRHIEEKSLQNAMGFNNDGAYKIEKRLKDIYPFSIPIGINLGKNKTTPDIEAINDYTKLFRTFKDLGDYFVINISSPNTPGLRDLQNEEFIKIIFEKAKSITEKPILLKIAPDMSIEQAVTLTKTAVEFGADGIIATNTTIDYSLVKNPKNFGGISGSVLKDKSYKIFKAISKELFGKTILISVGGIDSAEEAYRRFKAGASLVQIFTSLIYEGPSLVYNINTNLIKLLKEDGYTHISEAIGADLSESLK